MASFSRDDGRVISERDGVIQSVRTVLNTPLGSRVMNREYGSRLSEFIDDTGVSGSDVAYEVIRAVGRWEKRVKIRRAVKREENSEITVFIDMVFEGEVIQFNL